MPDDRWGPERAQHEFNQRTESDRRIKSLEDSRDRGREPPPPPPRDGYSGNGNRFFWILVAGLVGLFLAGVAGGIVMYREMGEVKALLKSHQEWIDYLKQRVDGGRR